MVNYRYAASGVLCIILSVIVSTMAAQSTEATRDESSCVDLIRELYSTTDRMDPERGYSMRYAAVVRRRSRQGLRSDTLNAAISMFRDRMSMITDEIEIYHDARVSISIARKQRQIMITDALAQRDGAAAQMPQPMHPDTLLRYFQVLDCQPVSSGEAELRSVTMALHDKFREKYQQLLPIDSLVLVFNPVAMELRSYTTYYAAAHRFESVRYIIHAINADDREARNQPSARSRVFGADGAVRASYKNFKIADVRKQQH